MYLLMCKKSKLTVDDMDYMTIGMCLNYIDEYFESINPDKKPKKRKATQSDFDSF